MAEIYDDVKPLSKRLQVPPLKDGQVAVFRLTKAFIKSEAKELPLCPEVVQINGVEKIVDIGEDGPARSKKMATTIIDYKQIGTSGQVKPIYEKPRFIKGELRVSNTNHALYQFLMRSRKNTSNRFRKAMGAMPADEVNSFFEVGTKEVTSLMKLSDMKFYAEKLIREASFKDLREIAVVLNANPDPRYKVHTFIDGATNDPEKMKYEMIQLAQQFPKQLIAASPDNKAKLKVQIYDGLVYGVLMYEKDTYYLSKDSSVEELFKPEEDTDKIESLCNFFMGDEESLGRKKYVEFATQLKKAIRVD